MSWFTHWFGSEFYDRLYKNRNEEEAIAFIHKVFVELPSMKQPSILDLCCGNGRHSLAMAEYGSVVGVDLNEEQIQKAKDRMILHASFFVYDMREVVKLNEFDFVFNLFSSFAYFDNQSDDLKTLNSVYQNLRSNGIFIQDFLNVNYVIPRLKTSEYKTDNELSFDIKRKVENKKIIKTIKVSQRNVEIGLFEEKLTAYTPDELLALHKQAGLTPFKIFGNYQLSEFDKLNSPRIIVFSKKG